MNRMVEALAWLKMAWGYERTTVGIREKQGETLQMISRPVQALSYIMYKDKKKKKKMMHWVKN
jgi:hypothetical protein